MSINTQRLTISLPNYLYDQLMAFYGRGEVSQFVSEAVESRIIAAKINKETYPEDELLKLKKKLPRITRTQILRAIAKGRA